MSRTFIFITIMLFVSTYCMDRSDSVNQIMDQLVEVNKAVETPAYKIGRTIAQVKAAAHASDKAFSRFYNGVRNNCKIGTGYLDSFMSKLQADLANAKAAIGNEKGRIQKNAKKIVHLSKEITKVKLEAIHSHRRHKKESKTFRKTLREAEDKLVAIRHIRNIIVDELLNGKGAASFIQVKTITGKLQELKSLVEKDSDPMFVAVVGSLLELATERNLNDQTILKKILNSLRKLHNQITRWKTNGIKSYKKLKSLFQKSNQAKINTVRALSKLLAQANGEKSVATRSVDDLSNAVIMCNKALKSKSNQKVYWKKLCDDQKRIAVLFRKSYETVKRKGDQIAATLLSK